MMDDAGGGSAGRFRCLQVSIEIADPTDAPNTIKEVRRQNEGPGHFNHFPLQCLTRH